MPERDRVLPPEEPQVARWPRVWRLVFLLVAAAAVWILIWGGIHLLWR